MSSDAPRDWTAQPLGQVARIVTGKTPSTKDERFWNGEVPFVTPSDIGNSPWCDTVERHLSSLGASTVSTAPAGAVMFTCIASIGKSCILAEPSAFNQQINACIPGPSTDSYFLYSQLQAMSDEIRQLAGTTAVPIINKTTFSAIPISLPPLDEQRRIAEVLRSVDDAIASNQQCLTQAGSVRAALLQRHFHMAEWADGQPLPDGWEMPLLDAVATRGSGHTPNKKIDSYWNGGIKWVSLQDTKKLDQVYISTTAQQISDDGIRNSSAVLHPDGVVVISRDATVGRSAITVGTMAVSQHFIAYRCGKTLNNHYLYYWLQRMKPVFERIGAGSTIKTIGLPFFKSLRIALPPLQQQSQIADVMLDADKAMMSAAAAIQLLHKVKAVVMSDLLSGHVRMPA